LARRDVGFWNDEGFLQFERSFDHGCDEALVDVPFDVAVEEPDAGVVGCEAEDDVAGGTKDECVAAHGDGRVGSFGRVGGVEGAGVFSRASDSLEVVTVEMEGMFAGIWLILLDGLATGGRLAAGKGY